MGMIIRSRDMGRTVYEVGYMDPQDGFIVYMQTDDIDEAEERCTNLNGGFADHQFSAINDCMNRIANEIECNRSAMVEIAQLLVLEMRK